MLPKKDISPIFTYIYANETALKRIWEKNIAANPGDKRWLVWREKALADNRSGRSQTYLVFADGEPVGEGTLLFSPECEAVGGRKQLADGHSITNINALRIEKEYEGKGHISQLVRLMEKDAREKGYRTITIGVEAAQTRNLGIYLHWGYDKLVMSAREEGTLVLYYAKELL